MMQEVEVLKTIQGADLLIFFRRTVYTIELLLHIDRTREVDP